MITIPTIQEIKDQIISDLLGANTTIPLGLTSVLEVIATAYAGVLYLCYKFGQWAYDQIFTSSMDEESLVKRAAKYGIYRNPAVKCQATGTATGTDTTIIPGGTLYQIDGVVYSLDSDTEISGSTTVQITSIETGEATQLTAGDVLSLATPQAGVDNDIIIVSITRDGEDKQSIESLRNQVQQREQNKPQGGAIPDFVGWALEVSGVGEAYAFRPTPGYVNVFILTDEADPADREPSSALRSTVEDYINDPEILPFGRNVSCPAWTVPVFDLDLADLSPNNATVRADVEEAITEYFYARRPLQYADQPEITNVISAAEIYDVCVAAGAVNITITLKNSVGTDITAAGYELEDYEITEVRTITWI